jgi:hypothetical protein
MCERVFVCFRHSSRARCFRRLRERLGHVWCHAWLEFGDCELEPGVCAFALSGEPALRVVLASRAADRDCTVDRSLLRDCTVDRSLLRDCTVDRSLLSPATDEAFPLVWSTLGGARSAEAVLSRLREAGALSLDPQRLLTCTELREAVAGSPLFEPLAREDTGEWGMEYV